MTEFEIHTTINAALQTVVDALQNPDNAVYWTTDLERFETIVKTPDLVGSVAKLHYKQNGKSYVMEDRMLYCEPGKKYVSQVTGDALTAIVETTLTFKDNATGMSIHWSGKGKIVFYKLLLPFLKKKMIEQSQKELETFKRLVETMGSNFQIHEV